MATLGSTTRRGYLLLGALLACSPSPQPPPAALASESFEARELRPIPDDLPLRYRIRVRLLPQQKRLRGRMTLSWQNVSRRAQEKALLHQYLNAFASPDTLFMRESSGKFRDQRADPTARGWVRVSEVLVDGQPARQRNLLDGTVLQIDLPQPVPPGRRSEISLAFEAQLPPLFARTGHADDFFMVAQWYPKLGFLRPDGSWHCPPFHPNGEFFGPFAEFEVTITLPPHYRVGATGTRNQLSSGSAADQSRELVYSARGVHDFAFSAWPHFSELRKRIGQVELRLLSPPSRDANRQQLLTLIDRSLRLLQRWLGRYPYPQLTVIDVPPMAKGAMGMEYPTLFTTWFPAWAPRGVNAFAELTVHELTHQYFQGIVATNEVDEPWLDEGLTSFVGGLVMDQLRGRERSFLDLPALQLGQWHKNVVHQLSERQPAPVARPANEFSEWKAYASTVYGRAATLLYTVDDLIGRRSMLNALSAYVRDNAFRHPEGVELRRQLLAHTPPAQRVTVAALLRAVLDRGDTLDYRLSCESQRVSVQRQGPIALPLSLSWRDSRGKVVTRRIARDARHATFDTPGARHAWLGPAGRLGLDATPLDNRCVFGHPARRAVAPIAARAQQLLQLLGP